MLSWRCSFPNGIVFSALFYKMKKKLLYSWPQIKSIHYLSPETFKISLTDVYSDNSGISLRNLKNVITSMYWRRHTFQHAFVIINYCVYVFPKTTLWERSKQACNIQSVFFSLLELIKLSRFHREQTDVSLQLVIKIIINEII